MLYKIDYLMEFYSLAISEILPVSEGLGPLECSVILSYLIPLLDSKSESHINRLFEVGYWICLDATSTLDL
jgi:hypothetical protein